ncbi:uncharacterized protein LOC116422351 isoform X2 [Sarcophilus harrisii]|uniref:uncharacterized protein LOC116422351 isoform X2 n=1 Tax=Sarcophilus harrisii TaxID=9305 RepID=UPI001301ED34|nr:uncharacterized protein LOC116422351 isoform X2 [Sarcophilus harrisii]
MMEMESTAFLNKENEDRKAGSTIFGKNKKKKAEEITLLVHESTKETYTWDSPVGQLSSKVEQESSDSGDEGGLWFTASVTSEYCNLNKPNFRRNPDGEITDDEKTKERDNRMEDDKLDFIGSDVNIPRRMIENNMGQSWKTLMGHQTEGKSAFELSVKKSMAENTPTLLSLTLDEIEIDLNINEKYEHKKDKGIDKVITQESAKEEYDRKSPLGQKLREMEEESSDSGDEGGLWFIASHTSEDDYLNKLVLRRNPGRRATDDEKRHVSLSYKPKVIEDSMPNENASIKGTKRKNVIQEQKDKRNIMFSFLQNEARENGSANKTPRGCFGMVCFPRCWRKQNK